MAHSTEFAGMAPMIAKYFGSPNGKAAASATLSAAKQVLAADSGRAAATANLPAARAAFTTAARPQMQAAAMAKPSPSKAPSPLFVMPARQPNNYVNGSALMRMHSSKQGGNACKLWHASLV